MKTVLKHYTADIGLGKKLCCAVVSDLHDRDPKEAIALLRKVRPDLILVAGDLMERHEKGASRWTVESMDAWQGIPRRRTWFTKCMKLLDGSLAWREVLPPKVSDILTNYMAKICFPHRNHQQQNNGQTVSSNRIGKMKHRKSEHAWDTKNGYRFLREASKLAPVVMGVGNHEWYFTKRDLKIFDRFHVILLDNQDSELTIGGQRILIGGLSTRYDMEWLAEFSMKEGKKILICHHPDYYMRDIRGTKWDTFDLVVAGHTHGGQWRFFSHTGRRRGIPVFSPGQGIFPKYGYGRYGKMIVSSGVSNTTRIPRFGNPREVVVVTLL